MKTLLAILAAIVVLLISNPSMESHKDKVNQKCKELNPITGAVGGCDIYSSLGLEYHNYGLCSTTNSSTGGGNISVGAFGLVFIVGNLNI